MLSGEGGFITHIKNEPFPEMINFRERLFPQIVGWENKKIFIRYIRIEWIDYIIFFHDLSIKLLVEFCRYQKYFFQSATLLKAFIKNRQKVFQKQLNFEIESGIILVSLSK